MESGCVGLDSDGTSIDLKGLRAQEELRFAVHYLFVWRRRIHVLLVAALLVQAPQAQNTTPRPGFRAAPPIFQQNCGTCHDGKQAPSITDLQNFSPEQIYEVLTTGKMKDQAAQVPDVQKRQIAEFLAARPMGSDEAGDLKKMTNPCPTNPPMPDPTAGPAWNGWSPADKNARFQPASAAGLTAAQVPTLKLKWAFGVPKAAEMHSQPTIVSGRGFFGSDAGYIYSLDAKTGCVYWAFHADSGTRTAPTVAPIQGQGTTRYAVYFVDVLTRAYALDAHTGKLLWKVRAGAHPRAKSTGSATVYGGRMYVPMSAMETTTGAVLTYECCTFRGHVTALDANTGKKLWTTFVIPEEPKPRGKNKQGVTLYGPAGGSVWNATTVDPKRRRIYVGTGHGVREPATEGTDSVIAMDMETGKIVWQHQEFQGDVFINNCRATGEPGDNCPAKLGPDYDFGGSALIMHTLPDGHDVIIAGSKGGVALALDLDKNGAVVWRTNIAETAFRCRLNRVWRRIRQPKRLLWTESARRRHCCGKTFGRFAALDSEARGGRPGQSSGNVCHSRCCIHRILRRHFTRAVDDRWRGSLAVQYGARLRNRQWCVG